MGGFDRGSVSCLLDHTSRIYGRSELLLNVDPDVKVLPWVWKCRVGVEPDSDLVESVLPRSGWSPTNHRSGFDPFPADVLGPVPGPAYPPVLPPPGRDSAFLFEGLY